MTQLAFFSTSIRYRIWFLGMIVFATMAGLLIHAWIEQVTKHNDYVKRNLERKKQIRIPRGRIYARKSFSSSAEPALLADSELMSLVERPAHKGIPAAVLKPETLQELAEALHIPLTKLQEDLQKPPGPQAMKLTPGLLSQAEGKRVSDILALKGLSDVIGVYDIPERRYPQNPLAFNIIGRVVRRDLDQTALEGLELRFDKELRGEQEDSEEDSMRTIAGNDLYLTLHDTMQAELQRIMSEEVEKLQERYSQEQGVAMQHGMTGSAVVLDAQTGAILAMATVPVNTYNEKGVLVAHNGATVDAFEPGSAVKPITIGAVLETGGTTPSEEWECENGSWRPQGATSRDPFIHDAEEHGRLTTTQVLARSSNICAAKMVAKRLGKEKLYGFLKRAGFGERTGTEFLGERSGNLQPYEAWDPYRFASIAYGQGMTTTALQMTAAIRAIANRGIWKQPYLVSKIVSPEKEMIYEAHPEERPLFRESTAKQLTAMMHAVMGNHGTASGQDSLKYPMACKTGTAERVNPHGGKGYDRRYWTASGVCFGPYLHPHLVVGVFLHLDFSSFYSTPPPATTKIPDHSGAKVAIPIVKMVMERLLHIKEVAPEPELSTPLQRAE